MPGLKSNNIHLWLALIWSMASLYFLFKLNFNLIQAINIFVCSKYCFICKLYVFSFSINKSLLKVLLYLWLLGNLFLTIANLFLCKLKTKTTFSFNFSQWEVRNAIWKKKHCKFVYKVCQLKIWSIINKITLYPIRKEIQNSEI